MWRSGHGAEQTARGVQGQRIALPASAPVTLPGAPTPADTAQATGTGGGATSTPNIYYAPNVGGVHITGQTGGVSTQTVEAAVDSALIKAQEKFVRMLDRELGIRQRRSLRATHGKI